MIITDNLEPFHYQATVADLLAYLSEYHGMENVLEQYDLYLVDMSTEMQTLIPIDAEYVFVYDSMLAYGGDITTYNVRLVAKRFSVTFGFYGADYDGSWEPLMFEEPVTVETVLEKLGLTWEDVNAIWAKYPMDYTKDGQIFEGMMIDAVCHLEIELKPEEYYE